MNVDFEWTDLIDGESEISVSPINYIAQTMGKIVEMDFVTANDISAIATFSDYSNFYTGIAGGYVDTSKWLDGQIIRIEDSAVPTLYVKKKVSPGLSLPNTEEAFIAELDSNGYAGNSVVTFRKYSEIVGGGSTDDIERALDSIIAIQNTLIGGDTE